MRRIPPAWVQRLGQAARSGHARRFEAAARDPESAQRVVLTEILSKNANVAYLRDIGLEGQTSLDRYRERVPIVDYTSVEPWVRRSQQGESGLLTTERPVYWLRTSGSTGRRKDLPITPSYVKAYQTSLMASLWHVYRRHPAGFAGRGAYLVSPDEVTATPDGTPVGPMTAFNYQNMPSFVRALYAWPPELSWVEHRRSAHFLALLMASLEEFTLFGGVFPQQFLAILRSFPEMAPEIAHAARTGVLPSWIDVEQGLLAAMRPRLRPSSRIADRLQRAAKDGDLRVAWPHLRLVYCWTGATAAPFVARLTELLDPDVAVCDAVYSASEGWMNVPMGEDAPGGPVAVHGHFLEFIPEAAYLAGSRDTLLAHELEEGGRYVVVLTTQAGLYRYDLQDVVICGERYHRTPRIRFSHKVGRRTNLVGELLDESHATEAIQHAFRSLSVDAAYATLVPSVERCGYALVVEPEGSFDPRAFAHAVEHALCHDASEYGACRAEGTLAPLEVRVLPAGTWQRWIDEQRRAGVPVSQLKASHLCLSESEVIGDGGTT